MRALLAGLPLVGLAIMLASLHAGQGSAGADPVVRVGSANPAPGVNFEVPVEVLSVPPSNKLGAVELRVLYDTSVITVIGCDKHPSSPADMVICNTSQPSVMDMTAISATGVSGNVLLAKLTLKVTGTPPVSTVLNVLVDLLANTDGQDMAYTDEDGVIVSQATGPATPTPTPFPFTVTPNPTPNTPTPTLASSATATPGAGTLTATPNGTPKTPTPTATNQGPTPTPGPLTLRHGDVDCNGSVDVRDALQGLRYFGALEVSAVADCPHVGSLLGLSGDPLLWGDVNCDGLVNPLDAIVILSVTISIPFLQWQPCPHIGEVLEL